MDKYELMELFEEAHSDENGDCEDGRREIDYDKFHDWCANYLGNLADHLFDMERGN